MERLASGSSIGLAGWGNPTLAQSGFTLFLRVHSARNLSAMGRGSYCKLYLGNTEVVNGTAQAGASFSNLLAVDNTPSPHQQLQLQAPTHRVFRTKVLYTDQKSNPEWNEKLELHVLDPEKEILTIRVKNQLMFFCPAIGACAIPLGNVTLGQPAEQWFPLHKAGKPAGHIRLQLMLQPKDPTVDPPAAVSESPMQRLIQQHCQQERDRRQQQQSDESVRRRQFEEQERRQAEMRRQREEAEERERTRVEEITRMQAYREERQREEKVKVQAYLQKQMEHEEDWHAEGLAEKIGGLQMDGPDGVAKEGKDAPNYYFADDMVTASTSVRSSSSFASIKHSFAGSQDGSRREEVVEAVELTGVVLGEVVQDALPSSDSSSSAGDRNHHSRRRAKESCKQRSRKQSQSAKEHQAIRPEVLLFPKASVERTREEIPQGRSSPAQLVDSPSSSEDTSSSEEERRRRRRRRKEKKKEKKARKKERRRKRKAKRKERRESGGYESSSSSSSSTSSWCSSSSSSPDERRKRKAKKHKKSKERARSQRESKVSTIPRTLGPPHANSYGPDHSSYSKEPTNKYSEPPPAYAKPVQTQPAASSKSPGYIETLPPQVQQKRSVSEMLSTAADVTSIMSNVASIATSVQQLAGGGDTGGAAGGVGIPFAVPDVSQFLGGQDLSALVGQDFSGFAGQDFSGLAGADTTAQYF